MIDNYKDYFKKVINQINKLGIKNMMNYFEFKYNENNLHICYYRPSVYNKDEFHADKIMIFKNLNSLEGIRCFSRLLRFGKKDYLNYTTYLTYYNDYVCDKCNIDFKGKRFKCINCFEVDLCYNCYNLNKKRCPECKTDRLFNYNKYNIFPKVSKIII
jgi:hypothetical protein